MTKLSDLVCPHKREETKVKQCVNCTGITNSCGYYYNPKGIDPFKDLCKPHMYYSKSDEDFRRMFDY